MSKYIIKNCPSLNQDRNLCNEIISTCCADYNMGREVVWCKDCTDCLLKRIVERCKETKERFSNLPDGVAFDLTALLGSNLHEEILSMLEIEECEE